MRFSDYLEARIHVAKYGKNKAHDLNLNQENGR